MRKLILFAIIMLCLSGLCNGQDIKVQFAQKIPLTANSYAWTNVGIWSDSTVKFPKYKGDSTLLAFDANGYGIKLDKNFYAKTSSLGSYLQWSDTVSTIATQYDISQIPVIDTTSLSNRINLKLNSADSNLYATQYDLTAYQPVGNYVEFSDTVAIIATKYDFTQIPEIDTTGLSDRIDILNIENPNNWRINRTGAVVSLIPQFETDAGSTPTSYCPDVFITNTARPDSVWMHTKHDNTKRLSTYLSIDSGATFTWVDTFTTRSYLTQPNPIAYVFDQLQVPVSFVKGDSINTYFAWNNNTVGVTSPLLTGIGMMRAPRSNPRRATSIVVTPIRTLLQAQADWGLVDMPDFLNPADVFKERDTTWMTVDVGRISNPTNQYTFIALYAVINDTTLIPIKRILDPLISTGTLYHLAVMKMADSLFYGAVSFSGNVRSTVASQVYTVYSRDLYNWAYMPDQLLFPVKQGNDRARDYVPYWLKKQDSTNMNPQYYEGGNAIKLYYSSTVNSQSKRTNLTTYFSNLDQNCVATIYPHTYTALAKGNLEYLRNNVGIGIDQTTLYPPVIMGNGGQAQANPNTPLLAIRSGGASGSVLLAMRSDAMGSNNTSDGRIIKADTPFQQMTDRLYENAILSFGTNSISQVFLNPNNITRIGNNTSLGIQTLQVNGSGILSGRFTVGSNDADSVNAAQITGSLIADTLKIRSLANGAETDSILVWDATSKIIKKYSTTSVIGTQYVKYTDTSTVIGTSYNIGLRVKYTDTAAMLAGYVPYSKTVGIDMQPSFSLTGAAANRYALRLNSGGTIGTSSQTGAVLWIGGSHSNSGGTTAAINISDTVATTGTGSGRGINIQRTLNSSSSAIQPAIAINDAQIGATGSTGIALLSNAGIGINQSSSAVLNTLAGTNTLGTVKLTTVASYASGGFVLLVRNAGSTNIESITATPDNLTNVDILSAAGTLNITATTGTVHYTFTGTTTTWTLPSLASGVHGDYIIKNRGSGDITLNSNAGGNDIYNTSAVNTYIIGAGFSAIVHNDGTFYTIN